MNSQLRGYDLSNEYAYSFYVRGANVWNRACMGDELTQVQALGARFRELPFKVSDFLADRFHRVQ